MMNTIEQYSQGYNDVLHDESQKYLKGYHNDLRLDIPDQQPNNNMNNNNPRINNRIIQRAEEQRRYLESLQQYSGRSDGSKFADFSNPHNNNNMSPFDRLNRNSQSNGQSSSRSNINAPVGLFATLGASDPSMIPVTERRANQMKYSKMLNESATALPLMKTYTKLEKGRPFTPSDSTKSIGTGVVEDLSQRYQPRVLDADSLRKVEKQKEYVQQLSIDKERYKQELEAQYEKDIRNGVIPKQEFNNFGESASHYPNHNINYETEREYMEKLNKQHNYSTQLDLDKEIARQQEAILEQQNYRNSGTLKVKEMQSQVIDNKQEFVIGRHPEELRLQKEEQKRQYRNQLDKQKEINEIAIKNVEQQNKRYNLKDNENVLPYEHKAAPMVDRHNYNQQRQLLIQENWKLQQQQSQQQQEYKEQLLQQQHQQQQQLLQQQRMEQDYIRTNSQRYINPIEQEEKERRRQEILKQQQLHDEITAAANAKAIPTERVSLYNKYKRGDDDSKNYQGSLVVGGRSYYVDPEEARQRKIQLQHEYSRQIAESANSQPIQNERKPLYYQKNQDVNDFHNGRIQMPNPVLSSARGELPQFNELMTTLTLPKLYQNTGYQ